MKDHKIMVSSPQVCAFFEISAMMLSKYLKQGAPKASRGMWDLKALNDWRNENIEIRDDSDESLIELKAENLRIKNERESLKRDTEKGLLFSKADLVQEWVEVFIEFRQTALALSNKLPAVLDGKTPDEMREIIQNHMKSMLIALSRPGKNRPSPNKKTKKK